jgi:hypothetical protein
VTNLQIFQHVRNEKSVETLDDTLNQIHFLLISLSDFCLHFFLHPFSLYFLFVLHDFLVGDCPAPFFRARHISLSVHSISCDEIHRTYRQFNTKLFDVRIHSCRLHASSSRSTTDASGTPHTPVVHLIQIVLDLHVVQILRRHSSEKDLYLMRITSSCQINFFQDKVHQLEESSFFIQEVSLTAQISTCFALRSI